MKKLLQTSLLVVFLGMSGLALADKTAGEHVDDSWIHTKVKSALTIHGGTNINIEVYHGVVQLAGFVDSDSRKAKIVEAAATIEGVKKVDDAILVIEPDRMAGEAIDDTAIASKVKLAIADKDISEGFDVNVESNRGVVLLSGFVTNADDAASAVKIAEGVKGVVKVIDGTSLKTD
jgi:osmotically-inducible protein OsmY